MAAVALTAAVLAGCGSSAPEASPSAADDDRFCAAVDDFVAASKEGDRTAMADALDGTLEDLPEEEATDVGAYVDALRAAPANGVSDGDGVEADSTDQAFRSYVADTCGDVKLPEELDATTTTSPPAPEGGGSTDDTTVDGGPVGGGGDTGTGGGAGVP